jgi:hypothetical protein
VTALSRRALNRATLDRQLLLRRAAVPALDVVRHLAGLQGQDPDPPYVGLWNRVEGFRVEDLTRLLAERLVVRGTLYRATQHLVAADDYRWLRPLLQPMLDVRRRGALGRHTAGIDPAELAAAARDLLAGRVLTRPELGRALVARWPGRDPAMLGAAVQALLPILHPPPGGVWRRYGPMPFALAEQWLGGPLDDRPDPAALVLRYLAAFGPATVADAQAWSGLTRLREVVEPLRPRLLTVRDEAGRELYDLPDAPRPDPDTPAPVRFLASLDNVVLGYADRGRLMNDEQRRYVGHEQALTVDGFVRGLWKLRRAGDAAALEVRLFAPLRPRERDEVEAEGARLLRFHAPEAAGHDVRTGPL